MIITLFKEQRVRFDSIFWTLDFFYFLLLLFFFRFVLWLRMGKNFLSRRRQFKWDWKSIFLPSVEIVMTTKPPKTT